MSDMPNGKTYTEVLLELYGKMDTVEQRLIRRLDIIQDNTAATMAIALDASDKVHAGMDKRIDANTDSIKNVRNLNAGIALLASTIAGIIGINK